MTEELYNKILDVITFCHLQLADRQDKLDFKYAGLFYELQSEYKIKDICEVANEFIKWKEDSNEIN